MDSLSETLKFAINGIAESKNIKNPVFEVSAGSEIGDGFASRTAAVTIRGGEKPIHLFIKYVPDNGSKEQVSKEEFFKFIFDTELRFYEKVSPVMLKFQREKGIDDIFENFPTHYPTKFGRNGIPPIILSNLKLHGFQLRNLKEEVSEDVLTLILKTYAKLHGTSLAMRDQKTEIFNEIADNVVNKYAESFYDVGMEDTCISLIKGFIDSLDPVIEKEMIEKCKRFCETLMEFVNSISKSLDHHAVVIHGDCWSNNWMFQYDENTGVPTDIKILDWQVYRLGYPAMEAAHAFYNTARKNALHQFEHYRTLYYETLQDHVRKLGSDIENLYPKRIFLDHWKKYAKIGLILSFATNRVAFMSKDDITDLIENEDGKMIVFPKKFKEKETYHFIMKELVKHFIENGFM